MIQCNVIENHGIIGTFSVDGDRLTGDVPDFITTYAAASRRIKRDSVEAYVLSSLGGAGNLLGLERSGCGIVLLIQQS